VALILCIKEVKFVLPQDIAVFKRSTPGRTSPNSILRPWFPPAAEVKLLHDEVTLATIDFATSSLLVTLALAPGQVTSTTSNFKFFSTARAGVLERKREAMIKSAIRPLI
jgi:hypothetical protein